MGCGASTKYGSQAAVATKDGGAQGPAQAPAGLPEFYPLEFASEIMSLARAAGLVAIGQEDQMAEVEESFKEMQAMNIPGLGEGPCQQMKDASFGAAMLALAELTNEGVEEKKKILEDAFTPKPEVVSFHLWKRTRYMLEAAGNWAAAEKEGNATKSNKEQKTFERHARYIKGLGPGKLTQDREAFAARASEVMPATIIMFSGCQDCQTSADVSNTANFGLPADAGPGGAGGACTNSMIKALNEDGNQTWCGLLKSMRTILDGKYTQIPQLCSSKPVDLNTKFSCVNPEPSGRYRALLIGINYVGSSAELAGCHNDVETMRRYLEKQGYPADQMRILLDDGQHDAPNKAGIEAGMKWLVEGAEKGDSLFFHYSGHGASVKDDNDDEEDGKDEALCPVDYSSAGLLRDDEVYVHLVGNLKEGVSLTCVLDCCHSGTILDLPYMFKADDQTLGTIAQGQVATMQPNPQFDFGKVLQILQKHPMLVVGAAVVGGGLLLAMGGTRRKELGGKLGLDQAAIMAQGMKFLQAQMK